MQKPYNGINDLDGCPDSSVTQRDSDFDGISDFLDACPLEPETYNLHMDRDGCPDSVDSADSPFTFPDTDGDGIDDRMDACIDEAENFNGYLDWDGCPEVLGAESTVPISYRLRF